MSADPERRNPLCMLVAYGAVLLGASKIRRIALLLAKESEDEWEWEIAENTEQTAAKDQEDNSTNKRN